MTKLFSRGRVAALAILATALVLLLALRRGRPPEATQAEDAEPGPAARAGGPVVTTDDTTPAEPGAAAEAAPIIDDVRVDKSRVCEGEVAIVTVEAHAPSGDDAALRTIVGTTPGTVAPIRLWRGEDGSASLPEVQVFGPRGSSASRRIPHVQVDRCPNQVLAFVEAIPVRNAPEQRRFRVSLRGGDGDGGAPPVWHDGVRGVTWSFGDGVEVKDGLEVVHDFALGTAVYPTFLVKATVELADGTKVMGATSVELLDRAAYERRQGRALIVTSAIDRFPVPTKDGTTHTQRFRIANREDVAITVDDVEIETVVHGDRQPVRTRTTPSAVIPSTTLAPRSEIEVTMTVVPDEPLDLDFRTFVLRGRAADGRPAEGALTTMAPLGPPSERNTIPISPALEARVLRAREILRKDRVTVAEVRELELQGRFADLPELSDDVPERAVD